jgi:hypothetical protein
MSLNDSARNAYNAYRTSKAYRLAHGETLPRWEEVPAAEQAAWESAAENAVLVALEDVPTISAVDPATWEEETTPEVTITGTNLTGATVDVDGLPCTSVVINEAGTEIVCDAPSLEEGTYDLTVTTYAGEAVEEVVITSGE